MFNSAATTVNALILCESATQFMAPLLPHHMSALSQVDRDAVQRLAKFGARHAVRFFLRKVVFDKFMHIQAGVYQFPLTGTSAIDFSLAFATSPSCLSLRG